MVNSDMIRMDFVCVHNAGRSQMAAAFAERESARRDIGDTVEIRSGGTNPADSIQEEVVQAMSEVDIDISDRSPKYVDSLENLEDSHYLITMGCSISKFNPEKYGVESRAWDLPNPDGEEMETVRQIRDEIEHSVDTLFDEIERVVDEKSTETETTDGVVTAIRDALSF